MVRHRALDFLSWSCPSEAPESLHGLIVIEPEPIEPAFHLRRPFRRQQLGTALNATDACNPVRGPRWHLGSRTFSPQGWSRGPLAGTVTRGAATPPRTTASLLTGDRTTSNPTTRFGDCDVGMVRPLSWTYRARSEG